MPLDFLRRRNPAKPEVQPTRSSLLPEDVEAQEYTLKLTYRAKASQGVRMAPGPTPWRSCRACWPASPSRRSRSSNRWPWSSREPRPPSCSPHEALQWINANHDHNPMTRHALVVLESSDAVDPAFETLALALLTGELDTSGFPEYDAIVGGVASHWDEATGDMIVHAVVGWGGQGVRGDTDRTAQKTLASLLSNVLASQHAVGLSPVERPVPSAGSGGLVCAHCGFASAHDRAFYCPKCGMRLLRG